MVIKLLLQNTSALKTTKQFIRQALNETQGVVSDPPPRVLVSDLISDGVNITINFWINTNEERPLEAFDRAAVRIVADLEKGSIEIYPPGSMIVKQDEGGGSGRQPVNPEQTGDRNYLTS